MNKFKSFAAISILMLAGFIAAPNALADSPQPPPMNSKVWYDTNFACNGSPTGTFGPLSEYGAIIDVRQNYQAIEHGANQQQTNLYAGSVTDSKRTLRIETTNCDHVAPVFYMTGPMHYSNVYPNGPYSRRIFSTDCTGGHYYYSDPDFATAMFDLAYTADANNTDKNTPWYTTAWQYWNPSIGAYSNMATFRSTGC